MSIYRRPVNFLQTIWKENRDIRGSIFEDDFISQMIRLGLNKVISQNQQNILIVDDLDRLDPEHNFRILNILSVHQDFSKEENKFGFSKIIIVCDLDNIRNIYEHKYGEKVDFKGYIEKFYSTSVFTFSNLEAVALYCQSDLTAELSKEAKMILGDYLWFFVKQNELTVRSIVKHRIKPIVRKCEFVRDLLLNEKNAEEYKKRGFTNGSNFEILAGLEGDQAAIFYIESSDFEYLTIVKALITIFGSYQNLLQAVKEFRKEATYISVLDHRIPALKVIAPMQHLMENIDKPIYLTVSLNSNESYPSRGNNLVSGPCISLFNIVVGLNFKWSQQNPYTGDESYYVNAKEAVDGKQIDIHARRLSQDGNKLTMNDLLSVLEGTLLFLKNRDYLDIIA